MKRRKQADLQDFHTTRVAGTRDARIVSAVQEGSHLAFAELYKLYSRRLYHTIVSITKSPEDAEDALQETFLRVHRAIHTFEGRSSVRSWLTRIAINSALLTLRKRRSRLEVLFDPCPDASSGTYGFEFEDSAPSPERLCDISQRRLRLFQALGTLDEPLAGPIRMQITKGASVKEIGRTLNLTVGNVKVRLHRARLRLSAACRAAERKRRRSFPGFLATSSPGNERESCDASCSG
jgi:RNA polymerase sigma-70 factor, ECF subfamily